MISLYRQSWTCLRGNLWFYLLFAAVFVLLDNLPFSSKTTDMWLPLLLQSTFVFGLHRHILLGRPMTDAFKTRLEDTTRGGGKFLLLFLVFIGLSAGGSLAGYLALHPGPVDLRGTIGVIVLIWLFTYFLLLVLFGTAMPAYVAGDRFGVGATLGRLRATALPIVGGLLIGPVLFTIVGIAVLGGVIAALPELPTDPWSAEPLQLVALLTEITGNLISLFATTLAVIVLCNAYRRTAPVPPVTPPSP